MKTPRVIFKYSWIYDKNWKIWIKLYPRMAKLPWPSATEIKNYIKKIEKFGSKDGKRVLDEISKVIGLKWTEDIKCYVVGHARGFSDPLTLGVMKDPNDFIDTLVHELIHQILAAQKGNKKRTSKAWDYIYKKYKDESVSTKNHIPVHAIHNHIYLKFFGKKRLEKDINHCQRFPDYKRSWEIVEKEGYENIIKEFRKRIK